MISELPPVLVVLFIYLSVGAVLQYAYVVARGHTLGNTHIHSQQEKLFLSYLIIPFWPLFIMDLIQEVLSAAPHYDVESQAHWTPLIGYIYYKRDHRFCLLFFTITIKYVR